MDKSESNKPEKIKCPTCKGKGYWEALIPTPGRVTLTGKIMDYWIDGDECLDCYGTGYVQEKPPK